MRALFSAVTGIRSHQVRMDVIGNNIANVNTNGFKSSRVTFQDVFSQTLSAGSAATTPQQVGLGVGIGSTDLNQGAGSMQMTGRDLDLAIEGNGMFVLRSGAGENIYTRVGNFDWDSQGYLVNPATGDRVQGWTANADGTFGTLDSGSLGNIQVERGSVAMAQMTTNASLGGNLDAGAAAGSVVRTSVTGYDSLGRPQSIILEFTKGDTDNSWTWSVPDATTDPAATGTGPTFTGSGDLTFTTLGTLEPASRAGEITMTAPGAEDQTITLDLSGITQAYAGLNGSDVQVRQANGSPMGVLESVSVDASGQVFGIFSSGYRRPLAQLSMATFSNPDGLLKSGGSAFSESASSGSPSIGVPNAGSRGRLVAGNLEMSNVDLSTEFTNMIMTQRGFQANTRVISTADEMLQDLVNLRR
jgi:flagellar hook protein FlgE